MAASRTLIEAYKSAYTIAELRAMLRVALDELEKLATVKLLDLRVG